jgi:CubicO group peptidase (beta-lactamase class C family)
MSTLTVTLPGAAEAMALPERWTIDDALPALTLVGPEADVRVAFVPIPAGGDAPEDIARAAWLAVDPAFALPILTRAEGAPSEGWGAVYQFVYAAPAAESAFSMAIVRMLDDVAYVNLVWGTKAGFGRRMAQIGEVKNAWRPEGLRDVDLNDREAHPWSPEIARAFSGFVRDAMRDAQVPGCSIAVVQDGAVVFAEGFGVTSLAGGQPVGAATRFMIGSTTKALTTLMMAKLVDAGRFAWETPVTALLPNFALADADTTRRLQMHHTVSAGTGMPRRDTDLLFRTRDIDPEHRIAEMAAMEPTTGFGETFQYSNYLVAAGGYAAARAFLPDASLADSYERAMRELVFEPLGMARTTLPPRNGSDGDQAVPHALDFNGVPAMLDPALERFADAVAPAGAAWSTASDLARYVAFELSGDAVARSRHAPRTRIDATSGYGLGMIVTREDGIATLSHGGNTLVFSSDMFFFPDKGVGAVVLTNLGVANVFLAAVRRRIVELLFDAPPTASRIVESAVKSARELVASRHGRIAGDAAATTWLAQFEGDYASRELGPAHIHAAAGGYRVDFESWSSDIAVDTRAGDERLIALVSPPWSGSLKLQPDESGRNLILDAAQTKYTFERISS